MGEQSPLPIVGFLAFPPPPGANRLECPTGCPQVENAAHFVPRQDLTVPSPQESQGLVISMETEHHSHPYWPCTHDPPLPGTSSAPTTTSTGRLPHLLTLDIRSLDTRLRARPTVCLVLSKSTRSGPARRPTSLEAAARAGSGHRVADARPPNPGEVLSGGSQNKPTAPALSDGLNRLFLGEWGVFLISLCS